MRPSSQQLVDDLRQPLRALALLNGVLTRRALPANVSEIVAEQEHTIIAMSHLVNVLLDISKLESGAIKPEIADFEVASLFAELRREFASLAQRKGLELHVEACSDSVRSDPSLIEQVVRNLVSNAIKYTQRGRVLLCNPSYTWGRPYDHRGRARQSLLVLARREGDADRASSVSARRRRCRRG